MDWVVFPRVELTHGQHHIRMAYRSEVVTDEGALHKFISIAALHTVTEHLACPLTNSLATGH
jgi:hypothetical protein